MFQVNDMVLYGAHGVCRVSAIEERDLGGTVCSYYVLKPEFDQHTTHFIPTGNQAVVSKLRRILSAEEIHALIASMPDEEAEWIEDDNARRVHHKQVLAEGDRAEIVRMIKALYLRRQEQKGNRRKIQVVDERFLQDAEKRLYEEFAHVLQITPEQVLPFIAQQIGGFGEVEAEESVQ